MISKKRILFISLMLLFALVPTTFVNAAWLAGWDQRVKITIDHNDIDNALVDFPILIYISSSSGINNEDITFIFDEIGANSLKIAVTESDGTTECYVEVEKWDLGNETAWLHSKISSISNISDTDLYFYFDNDHADNNARVGLTNSVPAENVWDSDFKFVYHMRDNPDNANIRDSTTNDNDGSKIGAGEPTLFVNGIIDGSQYFDGSNDVINSGADASLNFGIGDFTLECWIKTSWVDNHDRLINKRLEGNIGYTFFIQQTTGKLYLGLHDAGGWTPAIGNTDVNDGVDHYVAVTADRSANAVFYLDGNTDGGADISGGSGNINTATSLTLGYGLGSAGVTHYKGYMDEVRGSTGLRSASWIKATDETGEDDLLDFGTEETAIPPPSDPDLLFGAGFNSSSPYVELHWNHSLEDVQFFEVQNSSDGISWTYLGQTTTANYTDFQVVNGTERYYRIRACNQTDGDWYNSSWSHPDFEIVYFIPVIEPGPTIIQNVTGEWFYYNLTTINVTVGTHDSGDLNSTLDVDGDTYNCSEVVGAPGYVIEFEWTDVDQDSHCLWVCAYIFYDGVSAHTINVDLWNFTSTAWVTIGIIYDMTGFEWVNSSIYDLRMPNDFINSTGAVRGRFYHSSAGNINDDIYTDFLKLYAFIPFENGAVTEQSFFWIFIAIVLSLIVGLLMWLKDEHLNN